MNTVLLRSAAVKSTFFISFLQFSKVEAAAVALLRVDRQQVTRS